VGNDNDCLATLKKITGFFIDKLNFPYLKYMRDFVMKILYTYPTPIIIAFFLCEFE